MPIKGLALTGVPPLGGVGGGILAGQSWRAGRTPKGVLRPSAYALSQLQEMRA